jgi:phosphoglycerate dehydrogenase-like enzyme
MVLEVSLKVVIVREAPENIRQLMADQFPADWRIATVPAQFLIDEIGDADALIPEGTRIDGAVLEHARKLKFIQTGAGYDNVDIEECSRRGIQVANAAGINARAVAEHVLALILCWYKNIHKLNAAIKRGRFAADYTGSEICGKTIGVVGLGRIGREVAEIARANGLKAVGYHYRKVAETAGIELLDLPALLKCADIITVHVALNDCTRHMFGQAEFELMKQDAFFINTSRGAVVNEQALIAALQAGRVGGAGLDVFETEPLPVESPLCGLENVILTPHMAGEPDGLFFHRQRFQFFAENIARQAAGRPVSNLLRPNRSKAEDPAAAIAPVIIPEGYTGKILMVSISGDGLGNRVVLRSGDLWHREILRNTVREIRSLGFEHALIHELGGAHVRFEQDGTIVIHGSSQQYGACDKQYAAELVRKAFADRKVEVQA